MLIYPTFSGAQSYRLRRRTMENDMFRLITLSSALALTAAAPSFAQATDPMAIPTSPTTPGAPMTTDMPMSPNTPMPSTQADAMTTPIQPEAPVSATPVDAKAATVTQLIEIEFPSYDADKSGDLNQAEFSKWVLALHSKAEQAQAATAMDAKAKTTWAKNAFATADTDKSKKISKVELNAFLMA